MFENYERLHEPSPVSQNDTDRIPGVSVKNSGNKGDSKGFFETEKEGVIHGDQIAPVDPLIKEQVSCSVDSSGQAVDYTLTDTSLSVPECGDAIGTGQPLSMISEKVKDDSFAFGLRQWIKAGQRAVLDSYKKSITASLQPESASCDDSNDSNNWWGWGGSADQDTSLLETAIPVSQIQVNSVGTHFFRSQRNHSASDVEVSVDPSLPPYPSISTADYAVGSLPSVPTSVELAAFSISTQVKAERSIKDFATQTVRLDNPELITTLHFHNQKFKWKPIFIYSAVVGVLLGAVIGIVVAIVAPATVVMVLAWLGVEALTKVALILASAAFVACVEYLALPVMVGLLYLASFIWDKCSGSKDVLEQNMGNETAKSLTPSTGPK